MKHIFKKMIEQLKQNEDVVLCSILGSSGSSPRGAGAKMAVFADGTTMGTVGGGAVELRSIEIAKEALKEKKSLVKGFCLTKNDVEDIGMICGGNVTIYIQYFAGESEQDLAWTEEVYRLLTEDEEGWIINRISDGLIVEAGIYCKSKGLQFGGELTEEMYAGKLKRNPVLVKGEPMFYIEPVHRPRKVWIFGGGHVGKALVPVLAAIDFDPIVFDNRVEYAKKEMFPMAKDVVYGDFTKINDYIVIDEKDYVVIMTPGHQSDYELLEQVLYTDATYVGCIGSRHKVAATTKKLQEAGHTLENISRIHSPIGIEIKAETPEEIAISIAAELIEHRATKG
ncbi:MAG: XdhC family protein [Ruminococcus sp.]|nr:XdhC family protein [Ruminococcus sp.]